MLNQIISLHTYWILNLAIALGYILSRSILNLPFLRMHLLQKQRLKFVKWSLVIAILAFFIVPCIVTYLPISDSGNFQLQPVLMHASANYLQNHPVAEAQVNKLNTAFFLPSLSSFFSLSIVIGFIFMLGKYFKNILLLQQLRKKSFLVRKINNIHIYADNNSKIPFCWSFIKQHYVVVPMGLLENCTDLKLAVRHELQHIRQGDTQWLHFLAIINLFCFWNPFFHLWKNWLSELQEYSCDEELILQRNTSAITYAQCLIDTASKALHSESLPQGALGIMGLANHAHPSILRRRINMLFHYTHLPKKASSLFIAYLVCLSMASSVAYALTSNSTTTPLSTQHIVSLIKTSIPYNSLQVTARPEVVTEVNNIRSHAQARTYMQDALQNMKQYQPFILAELKNNHMPEDLLALPLVESGYRPLDEKLNRLKAAGVWQFIPSTAARFGLVIDKHRDDRLDIALATKAALAYLNALHVQFNDWKLAALAYEYGEDQTSQLIKITGSRDPWVLVRSSSAPAELKKYLALFDASVIVIHNPKLVNE